MRSAPTSKGRRTVTPADSMPLRAPDVGCRKETVIRTSESTTSVATTALRLRAERLRVGNGCGRGLETVASRTALLLRLRGTERLRLARCAAEVARSLRVRSA